MLAGPFGHHCNAVVVDPQSSYGHQRASEVGETHPAQRTLFYASVEEVAFGGNYCVGAGGGVAV
jgi:hypothetical protein